MRKLSQKRKRLILDRMIEILDRPYAWTKGSWTKTNKRAPEGVSYCLLGAAQKAYADVVGHNARNSDGGADILADMSLVTLIRAKAAEQGLPRAYADSVAVFTFNDAKTTKKADVLNLLREKRSEIEA